MPSTTGDTSALTDVRLAAHFCPQCVGQLPVDWALSGTELFDLADANGRQTARQNRAWSIRSTSAINNDVWVIHFSTSI